MNFRIGINLGDVIVEGDNCLGDGINVAARLQELAEPGGVCIFGSIHDQVENKLSQNFEDPDAQQMRNIAKLVRFCSEGRYSFWFQGSWCTRAAILTSIECDSFAGGLQS